MGFSAGDSPAEFYLIISDKNPSDADGGANTCLAQPSAHLRAALPIRLSLLAGFICLSTAYFIWGWSDDISDFQGDSSVYMLAARYFSPFWPSSPVFAEFARNMAYPPLFPLVIGLLGGSLLAGHLLVIASLLAAILCLYAWLRLENVGHGTSGCACLAFALMPGTYLQALNIWTENPYLFLSLLAIVLEARAETSGRERPILWWGASAAVAAATMVRAAALPLLIAYAIRLAIVRPYRWGLLTLASFLPFTVWVIWGKLHQPTGIGYAAQWKASYAGDPLGALVRQMSLETGLLFRSWVQDWLAQVSVASLYYLVLAAGCIGLLGCLRRLCALRLDGVYVVLYGALLLVWPFPAEARRLSYVLIPILLVQGLLLLRSLGLRIDRAHGGFLPTLFACVLNIAILPTLILTVHRFNEPLTPDTAVARHTEDWYLDDRQQAADAAHSFIKILIDLRHSGGIVPEGQCIFAIKPSVVSLYSGRTSRTPPPASADDAAFDRDIAGCRYAYALMYVTPSFHQAFYPIGRLSGRAHPLSVAKEGEGTEKKTYSALVEIRSPQ